MGDDWLWIIIKNTVKSLPNFISDAQHTINTVEHFVLGFTRPSGTLFMLIGWQWIPHRFISLSKVDGEFVYHFSLSIYRKKCLASLNLVLYLAVEIFFLNNFNNICKKSVKNLTVSNSVFNFRFKKKWNKINFSISPILSSGFFQTKNSWPLIGRERVMTHERPPISEFEMTITPKRITHPFYSTYWTGFIGRI